MSHTPKSTTSTDTYLTNSQSNLTDSLNVSRTTSADCTQSDNQSDSQAATYPETYFDALYNDDTDPWQYQTRWYEKRKRDMCLAVLPQAQYGNAIELGCGNGVFSELLAHRCQALVSIDGNNKAVQLAKQRLAGTPHVRVIQGVIPNALSTLKETLLKAYPLSDHSPPNKPPFDLIVISEILYYLSPNDINTVIAWIGQNLAIGGTLLCCHWRYAIEGFAMTGETVHQRLYQAFSLANSANNEGSDQVAFHHPVVFNHPIAFNHQSKTVDADFLLDVWQNSPNSVAMQENLV